VDLRVGTAMAPRSQLSGIDSCQQCQRPGIELIIFSTALADQSHVPRMGHDHFVAYFAQLPAHPRGVRSGFQCDAIARDLAEVSKKFNYCSFLRGAFDLKFT
jgi:hypothetical protein